MRLVRSVGKPVFLIPGSSVVWHGGMASTFLRPQFLFLHNDDVCKKVDALNGTLGFSTWNLFIFYDF